MLRTLSIVILNFGIMQCIILNLFYRLLDIETNKFHFPVTKSIDVHRICRNKRPGRLILRSYRKHSKTHQKPSVLCTPPFEKSPIKSHWFCVLPPLKNLPSKPIGFVYSPLWKINVFSGRLFRGGRLFRQIRYTWSDFQWQTNKTRHYSASFIGHCVQNDVSCLT